VKFNWQISAGELFELLRPAALVASALLSTWVVASARRWRINFLFTLAWALGTFLLPFVILPLYLIVRFAAKRRATSPDPKATPVAYRFILPASYSLLLLSLTGVYLYRDYHSLDAHLARASQATVMNRCQDAIREYRSALVLEDNPHTHKLLGIALAEDRKWAEALREFRTAESGGEPDELMAFRIGQALESLGNHEEAKQEFERFLSSPLCTQPLRDFRCAANRASVRGDRPQAAP
jgi:tetratricopeptide (TPR) repeat protein